MCYVCLITLGVLSDQTPQPSQVGSLGNQRLSFGAKRCEIAGTHGQKGLGLWAVRPLSSIAYSLASLSETNRESPAHWNLRCHQDFLLNHLELPRNRYMYDALTTEACFNELDARRPPALGTFQPSDLLRQHVRGVAPVEERYKL